MSTDHIAMGCWAPRPCRTCDDGNARAALRECSSKQPTNARSKNPNCVHLSQRDAIVQALKHTIETLAVELLDRPTLRTRTEWRWGRKGSLTIAVSGERRGLWYSHEEGIGGDPIALIQRARGCGFDDAIKWAFNWIGAPTAPRVKPFRRHERECDEKRIGKALTVWRNTEAVAGSLVATYLASRRVVLPVSAQDIRYHPVCFHGPTRTHHPAMVALMRDILTNQAMGVHCTFLTRDGKKKAALDSPKIMLGRAKNSCIKLCEDADVTIGVALAEGIENALSAVQLGWPNTWVALSAGGMRKFPALAGVDALTLFVDGDEAGIAAARECRDRWLAAGREVILKNPSYGADLNEAMQR